MRAIEGAVRAMSAYELLALAFVTIIVVAVMVATRAALPALRARYPRRLTIAGSLLLLYGLVRVLLTLAGQRGLGLEFLLGRGRRGDALDRRGGDRARDRLPFLEVLAERLLTVRQACGAILVSAAFGAAWVTVLRAAGLSLGGMPTMDAAWMLWPALLPLLVSVLAPWSLSRIRHT